MKYFTFIMLLALFSFSGHNFLRAQSSEYLVKASYIEKFARFTEWPSNSLSNEFIITIIGKDQFNDALEEIAKSIKIKNLPVRIEYISDITEMGKSNILFISQFNSNSLNDILSFLKNKPVLTISEISGACEKGVHINFYITEKGTIHFEVNPARLKRCSLKMDMYVLELGKIIGE